MERWYGEGCGPRWWSRAYVSTHEAYQFEWNAEADLYTFRRSQISISGTVSVDATRQDVRPDSRSAEDSSLIPPSS